MKVEKWVLLIFLKRALFCRFVTVIIKGTESGVGAAAGAGGWRTIAGSTLGGNRATRALGGLGGAVLGGDCRP